MNAPSDQRADDSRARPSAHPARSVDQDDLSTDQHPQPRGGEAGSALRLQAGDGLTALRDHWAMHPYWTPQRREHAVHLTVENAEQLHRLTEQVHAALAGIEQLVPVPIPWLHMTLSSIGAVDELGPERAERSLAAIREAVTRIPVGDVRADTLMVAHESVVVTGPTPAWLGEHVRTHREAIDEVLGPRDWTPLWPHISLAYSRGGIDAAQILEALAPIVEGRSELTVRAPAPSRVQLLRDETGYRWDDSAPLH